MGSQNNVPVVEGGKWLPSFKCKQLPTHCYLIFK